MRMQSKTRAIQPYVLRPFSYARKGDFNGRKDLGLLRWEHLRPVFEFQNAYQSIVAVKKLSGKRVSQLKRISSRL